MADTTLNDVLAAIDAQGRLWEEQKKVQEQRIRALEADKSTASFDEKLERMNDEHARLEKERKAWMRQQEELERRRAAEAEIEEKRKEEWLSKIEAKVNRSLLGLGGGVADAPPAKVLERKAFDTYLRRGEEKMTADETKVLTRGTAAAGGYLAPEQFVQEIIKYELIFSPVRELATVVNSTGYEIRTPKLTGLPPAAVRVAETAARSESTNPVYALVAVQAPEFYAEHRVSQQQIEDSAFNMEAELTEFMAWQFATAEGAEWVTGTGTPDQMRGITTAGAGLTSINTGVAAALPAATAGGDKLIEVMYALPTPYARNARWICNRAILGKIRTFKDSQGRWVWEPSLAAGQPATILGAPYTEVPDMPNEAAGADVLGYGDWKRVYRIVDRIDVQIARDPYTLAANGQVKFSARKRVGGEVVLPAAARLLTCAL